MKLGKVKKADIEKWGKPQITRNNHAGELVFTGHKPPAAYPQDPDAVQKLP